MTLTAKGQATRHRIIEGAATHLRSDAPGSMTLDDVLATTHTSKGQLFHYFPGGREELLLEVARTEAQRVLDDQQPHLDELDSWQSWDDWRDTVIARYRAQGSNCPMSALMHQVGEVPGAHEVIQVLFAQWRDRVRRGVVTMQEKGLIGPRIDADRESSAIIAGIQGGVLVLRSTGEIRHLEAVLDTLIDHLRSSAD